MMERKPYAISRLVIGVIIEVICSYITLPLYAIVTHMGGEIKFHGFGSDVHESVHGWLSGAQRKKTSFFWKKTGSNPGPDSGGEVEVIWAASNERMGSSRNMLLALPPPDLDEIVTVDDVHGLRR